MATCELEKGELKGWMQGGDMWSALRGNDREELQWYGKGRGLALDVARGLHFLHEHKASSSTFMHAHLTSAPA